MATGVFKEYLKHIVESISIPRHFFAENENNRKVRDWISTELRDLELAVRTIGEYQNVVGQFPENNGNFKIIVGAHYDSAPGSPGADDNASAVAGLIATAKALKALGAPPVLFVAFNREEDGLLGSKEFARFLSEEQISAIECVHILEMIGFSSDEANSQSVPKGLPIKIDDVGNFIAVIANRHSNRHITTIMNAAAKIPALPVKALKVFLGVEKLFPHLLRSDHSPFWEMKVPALMWTDTSEFRNPNYHLRSDLPDTLNYDFMTRVCNLLVETILRQLSDQSPT